MGQGKPIFKACVGNHISPSGHSKLVSSGCGQHCIDAEVLPYRLFQAFIFAGLYLGIYIIRRDIPHRKGHVLTQSSLVQE
jgi:hypothetical protein